MTGYDDYEANANEATGYSGFGGHHLSQTAGGADAYDEGDDYVAALSSLGIEDAEQLVAVAAIPEVRGELETALGIENEYLQSLVDQAQETLPAERRALVTSPAPTDFGLGVLPPTPEIIEAAEASAQETAMFAEAVALSESVNLIPYMSPIRSQASRGTCVSFTLTALNEYVLRRRGVARDLSEQHLYYEIKLIDGDPNACGTFQAKAVNALQARGHCREQTWPYNPNPPCNNHGTRPTRARAEAQRYRLTTLAVSPRNVLAYKTHLSQQRPVTLSIPVYNSWYQSAETRRSGRITMRIGNEPSAGGHAVLLVGYQDTPNSPGGGYFIVRNSWDTIWASRSPYGAGYGTIPYQYISNDAWEAFTAMVPGVTSEEEEGEDQLATGDAAVTIDVKPNITITISARNLET